jgi:hypothetical protein
VKFNHRSLVLPAVFAVSLFAGTGVAFAQSQRPYKGLFAGRPGPPPPHQLDVTVTGLGAYDDNLLAEGGGGLTPTGPTVSGFYSMLLVDAAYSWHGRKVQFGATGGTAVRHYNETDSVDAGFTTGVGFSAELGRRFNLSGNQTVAYSPSYLYGLFPSVGAQAPGDAIPVAPDYAVNDSSSYVYGTTASISHGLTRRGTISGTVDYQRTDFLREQQSRRDLTSYGARIQYGQSMSRNGSLRMGYQYRTGDFGYGIAESGTATEHSLDVGVEYVRPLSATRRMTFSLGLGPSVTDTPTLRRLGLGNDRRVGVRGDVAFMYQFNRTWETWASYERGLQYIPELASAVNTDGISATVGGLFSPTMDFSASAAYSSGVPAGFRSASSFDTYTASVRLRRAITSTLAVNAEYLYYFYDFGPVALPTGVPSSMERNGVRVGLTLWMRASGR